MKWSRSAAVAWGDAIEVLVALEPPHASWQAGACQVCGQASRMGQLKAMHTACGKQVYLQQHALQTHLFAWS